MPALSTNARRNLPKAPRRRQILAVSIAALAVLGVSTGNAQDNWTGATNASWDTVTNWSLNAKPGAGDAAVFPAVIPGTGAAITLGAGETALSLQFDNAYVLGGGNVTLGAGGSVTTNTAGSTINSVIAGTNGLTKLGTSSLTLTAANTYSGGTALNAGTLLVNDNSALGTGALTIAGGTTIGSANNNTVLANAVRVNGNFTVSAPGNFIFAGPVSLENGIRTITGTTNQGQPTFRGVVSNGSGAGAGGITFTTANLPAASGGVNPYVAFIMDGAVANTYSGLTTVNNNAFLVFNNPTPNVNKVVGNLQIDGIAAVELLAASEQISDTSTVTVNSPGSQIIGAGATTRFQGLELFQFSETIGTLNGNASGTVGLGAGTFTVGAGNYAGAIVPSTANGQSGGGNFVKNGTGTLVLSGSNTYTGATRVEAGTLNVSNALGLSGTPSVTVGTLTSAGTLNYAASANAQLTIPGTLTLLAGGNSTIGGSIGAAPGSTAAILVTGPVIVGNAGNIAVNVFGIPGVTTGATGVYTLLSAPAGGLTSPTVPTYSLGKTFNNTNFTVGGINATNNAITANIVAATPLIAAFWKGGLAGAANVWAASDGTGTSNWARDVGGTATALVPGSGTDVTISATTRSNQGGMVLGAPMTIKSLTITDPSTVALNADGNTLTVTNSITVNTAAAVTLNAPLAGAATLSNVGAGTLNLGGSNTYTGATSVSNGTLNVIGSIASGSALTVLANGALAGTGTISGGVNYSSTSNSTFQGVIAGAGKTLVKSGVGTLILSGTNTYTGGTTLNAGVLAFGNTKAFGSGNLTVNGGTLQNSTFGTTNVPRLLDLGAGNLAFNGGSIAFIVGGKDGGVLLHDQLTTTGSVIGPIGGHIVLKLTNGYLLAVGDKVTLVSAEGGVAGGTATGTAIPAANVEGLAAFSNTSLVPAVNLYSNSIVLEVTQGSFLALTHTLNLSPNQQALAAALDSVAASLNNQTANVELFQFLNSQSLQSPGSVPVNLELLAPTPLTSIFNIGTALSGEQNANLGRHFDELRSEIRSARRDAGMGSDSGSGAGTEGPSGRGGKEIRPPQRIQDNERWGAFLIGSGNFTSVGSTANAAGYNLDTGGVTAGLEYKIAANFVVGIDAGYASTTARLVNGGKVDVDSGQFGIFATYFDMDFYVDAAVHFGVAGYKTRRTALGGVATASPEGTSTSVLLAGGYDWKLGGLTIGPTASFQYTNTRLDGFTETGSLAPLNVGSQDGESTRTGLGVRASYETNVGGVILRPELRAGWQHEFGDVTHPLTSNFANFGGTAFTVNGPQIGRDSLLIGAGVTVVWNSLLSTFVAYDGDLGRTNYESHSVSGGVRVKF